MYILLFFTVNFIFFILTDQGPLTYWQVYRVTECPVYQSTRSPGRGVGQVHGTHYGFYQGVFRWVGIAFEKAKSLCSSRGLKRGQKKRPSKEGLNKTINTVDYNTEMLVMLAVRKDLKDPSASCTTTTSSTF